MKKLTEKVIFIAEDNGEIRTMIRFDINKRVPVTYKCSSMNMEEIGDSYELTADTVAV